MNTARIFVSLCVVASIGFMPPVDAAEPKCFGKKATVEGIVGTPANDVIIGTDGPETIDGGEGNDTICGLGGEDVLEGGFGNDKIDGGDDADTIVGDIHSTTSGVDGDAGDDVLNGGLGFTGSLVDERIVGDHLIIGFAANGGGADKIDGGDDGANVVGDSFVTNGDVTGSGADKIKHGRNVVGDSESSTTNSVNNAFATGSGNDKISKSVGFGIIVGDSYAHASGSSTDAIAAFSGFDGEAGKDKISGGETNQVIGDHRVLATDGSMSATGAGNDKIKVTVGTFVSGDSLNDATSETLGPDGGDDKITGSPAFDTIRGGPGDDKMNGGGDIDTCDGEGGTDKAKNCESAPNVP